MQVAEVAVMDEAEAKKPKVEAMADAMLALLALMAITMTLVNKMAL